MATALARGFLRAGLVEPADLLASDPVADAREAFARETRSRSIESNLDTARFGKLLLVAVKPDQVRPLLREIAPSLRPEQLLVSIAAGISIQVLEGELPAKARVVRVMPNTPALVGSSATAFARGNAASPEDAATVRQLFSSVGLAFEVKETLLDAVTGLSGSGPAYIYLVIEALSDGGVAAGLPREVALNLAAQTVLGSAKMVLETGIHPGALRDMVTSPGGTTIEGLHELEKSGLRAGLMNAVRAAAEKSKKLGQV